MRQNKTKTEIIKKGVSWGKGRWSARCQDGRMEKPLVLLAESAGDDGDGYVWQTDEEAAESATIWVLVARIEAVGHGLEDWDRRG